MYRLKIIIPFLLLSLNLLAQNSFQEVESISYRLYTEKSWQELSEFGKLSSEKGYDYYYLNVRIGTAFFELKDFEKAKIYFEKALHNSSTSTFAKEYLFWCYYNLEEISEAQKTYKFLPDSIKKRMDYQPSRIVDYIYSEGGMKISNNKDISGNLMYGRIGISHKVSPRFTIYQQYSYMQKNVNLGDMKQHQYLLIPSLNLNKKWTISAALNYSNYQKKISYNEQFSWKNEGSYMSDSGFYYVDSTISKQYIYGGNYKQNALLSQININKKVGRWSFTPHVGFYRAWTTPDYDQTVTTQNDLIFREGTPSIPPSTVISQTTYDTIYREYKEKEIYQQWQHGVNISYNFNKTISLGADINYIYNKDFGKWNIIPYMSARVSKNISLSAYYLQKNNYVLSIFEGSQLLNYLDKINRKINITVDFKLFNKFDLFTTYQYESATDNLSLRDYQLNSVFIGLKFRP